ncbi:MAG: hypothetical protein HC828_12355 [Blastochloris sp.]|nr:hypothetical protein [Blastochloris sp.]
MKRHFRDQKASALALSLKTALDQADSDQEVKLASLPLETLSFYETKGKVLELMGDLIRAARNTFEEDPKLAAQFNKKLLERARAAATHERRRGQSRPRRYGRADPARGYKPRPLSFTASTGTSDSRLERGSAFLGLTHVPRSATFRVNVLARSPWLRRCAPAAHGLRAVQAERLDVRSWGALWMNFIGSGCILLSLIGAFNLSATLVEGAWALMQHILSPENVALITEANGAIPARLSVLEQDERFAEGGPLRIYYEQLVGEVGVPRPQTPAYNVITAAFASAVAEIAAGADVQDALDEAVDRIDADIEANNGYATE